MSGSAVCSVRLLLQAMLSGRAGGSSMPPDRDGQPVKSTFAAPNGGGHGVRSGRARAAWHAGMGFAHR
ncbi:hypothetical protein [Neoasaia chiangmaiensis]|uniref:hypothetical protein n=1 Tax=Neoasaia chiangmaiensis TaxID=320497 RepID=UPI0011EA553A|nr:hypothetical protein [Neoasaia chiangmaiensis]